MWSENATWQYWAGDGVDGEADGAQPCHPPGRGLRTWPHDASTPAFRSALGISPVTSYSGVNDTSIPFTIFHTFNP